MQKDNFQHLLDLSIPLLRETISERLTSDSPGPRQGDLFNERDTTLQLKTKRPDIPKLSVIIPTYNRPQYLLDAVRSLSGVADIPVEVIIVQDAGKQLPTEILDQLNSFSLGLSLLRHEQNQGLGGSRNTGALHARGEWLCFLDDDDLLISQGTRELIAQTDRFNDSCFFYGDHIRHIFEPDSDRYKEEYHRRNDTPLELLSVENKVCCGSFIIRREDFISHQGYRQGFYVHEDYNLHVRLTVDGFPLRYLAKPTFIYNIRQQGRMNVSRRLYWFATANLNHQIFRKYSSVAKRLPKEALKELEKAQTINHYQHISRALREGVEKNYASELIIAYFKLLEEAGLTQQISQEREVITAICPGLL